MKILFVLFLFHKLLIAQDSIYIELKVGYAFYKNPLTNEWIPLQKLQKLPFKSVILCKNETQLVVYRGTEQVNIETAAYFICSDLFIQNTIQIISEFNKMDLFRYRNEKNVQTRKAIVYGNLENSASGKDIPYFNERIDFIAKQKISNEFYSLIAIKRLLYEYPSLANEKIMMDYYFDLLYRVEMYGYILDEKKYYQNQLNELQLNFDFKKVEKHLAEIKYQK